MSCFRLLAAALTLSLGLLLAQPALADELFSRVKTDAVFATPDLPATGGKPGEISEKGERIGNLSLLFDRIRDSGLEPQREGEQAVLISLQHSRWTFPIRLELVDQGQKVLVQLALESSDKKPLPADRLTGLLAANSQIRPACFTFSATRKRLELVVPLANENLSARALREELRNLASLAEKTAPVWDSANAATNGATPPASTTPPASPVSALVGKWSASRSATESFTLQLKTDGSFELVHVRAGRSSRSTGRFEFTGRQLTLTGSDNAKIVGEVGNLAAKSFEFTPNNSAAAKLAFQKAS
jgi:hypothetical protein